MCERRGQTRGSISSSAGIGVLCCVMAVLFATGGEEKGLVGNWEGTLKAGSIRLRLVFRASADEKGGLSATMDSPDQGATGIPVASATLEKKIATFKVPSIGGEYTGTLAENGKEIVGEWKQAGQAFPVVLKRVDKPAEAVRPQTPKPPFPYKTEEVRIENAADRATLAGTLTLPDGAGPFPCVVLISGSGAQDRDESIMGHKPFLVIADALTRRGFAVLRVDDRGVGRSTGDAEKTTTEDNARDVESEIAYLKTRKDIDRTKIGLIGHSEGGIIAPLVASRSKDVALIVLLAGTGVAGEEIMLRQAELIIKAEGGKEEDLKRQRELQIKLFALAKNEKDPKIAAEKMKSLIDSAVKALPEATRKKLGDADQTVAAQIRMVASPWMRFFMTYDPRPALAKVRCPVLAIGGEKDLQVDPKQNLPEIEKALRSGGNTRATIVEVPGVNHLLQTCKTGSVAEYAMIEETVSPKVLKILVDWLTETVKRR